MRLKAHEFIRFTKISLLCSYAYSAIKKAQRADILVMSYNSIAE